MKLGVRFSNPSRGQLDKYLESAERRPLSYHPAGMTDGPAPKGYRVLDRRVTLGSGRETFDRAVTAMQSWAMLDISWVVLYPDCPVPRPGLTVVVAARSAGIWTINPTRIVRLIDEPDRAGFAYGTVEGHSAAGEERFEVSFDEEETVSYRITAYSSLRHPLARLVPPIARRVQQRFAAASLQAMQDNLSSD